MKTVALVSNEDVIKLWILILFFSFCTIFAEGSTEREFLTSIETMVKNSLPHDKLKSYFADPESVIEVLLNKITFCNDRIKVYGSGYHMIWMFHLNQCNTQ